MAKKPIEIAGETFPTQGAAKERLREIMAGYRNGTPVNAFDQAFLLALLERHPETDRKLGAGAAYIYVDQNPVYPNTRTFFLARVDGSVTDFSYLECLKTTPHHKKVLRALRTAVEPDTMRFKQEFFDRAGGAAVCPINGKPIWFVGSHVDHAPPATFDNLVAVFLDDEGLTFEDIAVIPTEDNTYQDRLADPDLERKWIDFHTHRATLRVISQIANLSTVRTAGRQETPTP